jgi:integrase/recombinase XerD
MEGETLEYSSPLFLSHTPRQVDQCLTYQGVYYFVKQLAKVTVIKTLHPHSFRHTYATELLRQGLDPAHARRLSGHKSEQVFRRYTQSVEQDAAIAAFYRTIGQLGEPVAAPVISRLLSKEAIANSEET